MGISVGTPVQFPTPERYEVKKHYRGEVRCGTVGPRLPLPYKHEPIVPPHRQGGERRERKVEQDEEKGAQAVLVWGWEVWTGV